MKIWLLQANEPMPKVHDGSRLFRTGMIAEELVKRGHEVTWFATTFDHFKKVQMFNSDKTIEVLKNYKLELIWAPGYKKNISVKRIINHKYMAVKLRKKIKVMEKPDLIYASFPTIEFAEEAIRYGNKNNIPVIIDVRDLWPDIFNHNLSKLKRIIAFPYIYLMQIKTKKIMKHAFAINGISPKFMEWGLNKAKREKQKYDSYFYMGYDASDKENKEDNNIENDDFKLCFFGTLNNQFEFDKIIDIAENLKSEKVSIYICGLGENYQKLLDASLKNPVIKVLGWQDKKDLQKILRNSNLGIANYKPTFDFQMSVSNKFAEYLSYGLPIMLTSGGYMGELIDEYKCGINSSDVSKLTDYIKELKENKEKYELESTNAKKLYEEKFIAKNIYKELVDYLEKIIEEEKK